jgi:hypothetical protein
MFGLIAGRRRWVALWTALAAILVTGSAGAAPQAQGDGPANIAVAYALQGDASNVGTDQTTFSTPFDNGFCAWCFHTTSSNAQAVALKGQTEGSTSGIGVLGIEGNSPSPPYLPSAGVYGFAQHAESVGVNGQYIGFSGPGIGVRGFTNSSDPNTVGVRGIALTSTGAGVGVWGSHAGPGWGVYGFSSGGAGVVGQSSSGFAGYFFGNVNITGTLTKGAGSFKIDDPLDPAHKYLQHSFVESPDMMNVYNGNITTDSTGFAIVTLPNYFQALNRDFRYQLTIIGTRGWNARVVKQISGNHFTIQTDQPNVEVSWQVTGIRHDAYANAHRIPTVTDKTGAEQGTYLHPELFGQPLSKSVFGAQMHGKVAGHMNAFLQSGRAPARHPSQHR